MRRMRHLWMLIVITLYSAAQLAGQAITLSAYVDTNEIRIGEQIRLSITAKTDTQTAILWPDFSESIQEFELIDESGARKSVKGDSAEYTKTYTITSFEAGEKVLEPIAIPFRMNGLSTLDSISTNPIDIKVYSVEVDTSQPFKPIKAPVEYPLTWRDYLPYVIGGILLVILAVLLIRQARKKRKPVTAVRQIKETKRPAHVVAMEELLKLERQELWQKGEVKSYHDQLSDIVRAYIEERFQVPALESTTDELSKRIRSTALRQEQLDHLLAILSIADLAKFARWEPTRDENLDSMERAKKFIESTKSIENEGNS